MIRNIEITVSVIVSSNDYRIIDCPVCPCQQCGAFQDGARVGLLHRGGPSLHWCWDRCWCWCWCWDRCTWTAFNKSAILAQMQYVVSKRKANTKCKKNHVHIQCNRQSNVISQKISKELNVFTVFRLSMNMSTQNNVIPSSRQGCHDVLKIWYKDKWYNDVHQGLSTKSCCTDIFSSLGML